jgi:ATP-dependent Lon protease
LAAHRGGIKIVVIPDENQRDLKEIPDNIKADLEIKPVKWIDEVLDIALKFKPEPLKDEPTEPVSSESNTAKSATEQISTH